VERSAKPSRGGRADGNRQPSPCTATARTPPEGKPPIAGTTAVAVAVALGLGVAAASSLRRTIAGAERVASRSARIPQGCGQQVIADLAATRAEQPCIAGAATAAAT